MMMLRKAHRWSTAVHLQSTDGGHQHHHVGSQAWVAALNVEELLHANVSTEASLSDWGCEEKTRLTTTSCAASLTV